MAGSPPGSSVHGILQARILEWGPKLMSGDSNSKLWLTGQPCSLGGCGRLWETQKYVVLSLEFVLYNSPPWTSFIYIAGFYAQVQYKILKVRIMFSSDMTETFFNLKHSTKLKTKFLFSFCLFLSPLSLCVSYIYKYIHTLLCLYVNYLLDLKYTELYYTFCSNPVFSFIIFLLHSISSFLSPSLLWSI